MGDDINQKRDFVASLYPSQNWRKRVSKMPDAQVLAIYFRAKKDEASKEPKKKEGYYDDIPF